MRLWPEVCRQRLLPAGQAVKMATRDTSESDISRDETLLGWAAAGLAPAVEAVEAVSLLSDCDSFGLACVERSIRALGLRARSRRGVA